MCQDMPATARLLHVLLTGFKHDHFSPKLEDLVFNSIKPKKSLRISFKPKILWICSKGKDVRTWGLVGVKKSIGGHLRHLRLAHRERGSQQVAKTEETMLNKALN